MPESRGRRAARVATAVVGGAVQVAGMSGLVVAGLVFLVEGRSDRAVTVAVVSAVAAVTGYAVVRRAGFTGRHVVRGVLELLSLP